MKELGKRRGKVSKWVRRNKIWDTTNVSSSALLFSMTDTEPHCSDYIHWAYYKLDTRESIQSSVPNNNGKDTKMSFKSRPQDHMTDNWQSPAGLLCYLGHWVFCYEAQNNCTWLWDILWQRLLNLEFEVKLQLIFLTLVDIPQRFLHEHLILWKKRKTV